MKEASAKAVAAAKQHAADMSRDLEEVHDELEVRPSRRDTMMMRCGDRLSAYSSASCMPSAP